MRILKRENFNDTLALVLIPGVPGIWVLSHWYPLPPEAVGASILAWGNVVQHYFRKAKNGSTEDKSPK